MSLRFAKTLSSMRISTTTTPAHNSLSASKNSKSKSLSTTKKKQYTTTTTATSTSPSIDKSKTVSSAAPGSPSPSKSTMTTATADSSTGGTTIEIPLPSDASNSGSDSKTSSGVPLLAKCSTDASELDQDHLEQQQQQQEELSPTSASARLGAVPEEDVPEDGKSDAAKEEEEDDDDDNSMETFPTFPQNTNTNPLKENNSNSSSGSKAAAAAKAAAKAKSKAKTTSKSKAPPRSSDSTSRRSKSKKQEPLTTVGMISSACIPSSPMRHAADSAGLGHGGSNAGALAGTNAGLPFPTSPRSTRGSQAHKSTASNSITLTRQQSILHESGKMLEYARKEVHKLRSKNAQLNTDFELLKANNQRLIDANCSLGDTCDTLNSHAKTLSKANHKLKSDAKRKVDRVKKELMESKNHVGHLNTTITELKEELKMKHGSYIGEVQSRLQYQKTMAKIVETIQIKCRDHRLVETILSMCDDCEELHDC